MQHVGIIELRPCSDIEIAWTKELDTEICIPVKKYKATIFSVEKVAHNVTRVRAAIKGTPMAFIAGQYASINIGKLPARSFSMASLPSEETLEFHIRHVPGGIVSSYIAEHLSVGEKLKIEGPFGSSYLRENHQGPIIAAAGGTGLAPVISIVKQALLQEPDRPIHLYFGVQDEAGIYCEEELKQLAAEHSNVNLQIILSDTDNEHARRKGFVHEAIDTDIGDMVGVKIYAAGPPLMIEALTTIANHKGVTDQDIHNDPFTASGTENAAKKPRLMRGLSRLFNQ